MPIFTVALVGGLLLAAPASQSPGFDRDAGMSVWVLAATAANPAGKCAQHDEAAVS